MVDCLKDQTTLVKHLRFAYQIMFDCLATSQNIVRQAGFTQQGFQRTFYAGIMQKMLDEQCLEVCQTVKHFVLQANFSYLTNSV